MCEVFKEASTTSFRPLGGFSDEFFEKHAARPAMRFDQIGLLSSRVIFMRILASAFDNEALTGTISRIPSANFLAETKGKLWRPRTII